MARQNKRPSFCSAPFRSSSLALAFATARTKHSRIASESIYRNDVTRTQAAGENRISQCRKRESQVAALFSPAGMDTYFEEVSEPLQNRSAAIPLITDALIARMAGAGPKHVSSVDETYIKVKGQDKYLYRAVDSTGQTIDFLLAAKRNTAAARSASLREYSGHPLIPSRE